MPIRKYKPTSPGRRSMSVSTFEEITKKEPEKSLIEPLKKHAGRNNQGRITTRHRGGGHKRFYRIIDFKRNKTGVPARVAAIEYDPNRSARIALLLYVDGEKRYMLAPVGLKVGDTVVSGPEAPIRDRQRAAAAQHPDRYADPQHRAATRARAARLVPLRRRVGAADGESRTTTRRSACRRARCGCVHLDCMATLGQVGNVDHENIVIGKAGRNRHHGQAADGPRLGDEPARPSARRW